MSLGNLGDAVSLMKMVCGNSLSVEHLSSMVKVGVQGKEGRMGGGGKERTKASEYNEIIQWKNNAKTQVFLVSAQL